MKRIPLIICCFFAIGSAFSQIQGTGNRNNGNRQMPTGSFYGKILDSLTDKPIEYASVQILQNKFDSLSKKRKDVPLTGMITKANGEFRLENVPVFGQMKLQITVVGYKTYTQPVSFDIKRPDKNSSGNGDMTSLIGALDKDLGNIKINIESTTLSGVTVVASTPGLKLGIDRKVFSVDKNIVSSGGSAVDVMKNVPSVSVDIDGNITMRNNTPQIFVDGKPTTMTLDQIPADVIDNVEIITNPSAKFDASGGTAGIINIVLKKNKKVGYNGGIRTSVDSRWRIGVGGDINLRQDKVNLFLSANYNQRKSISDGTTTRSTLVGTPLTDLTQNDHSVSLGHFMFYRGGADFFLSNRNTLSVAANLVDGQFKPTTSSNIYTDYLYTPPTTTLNNRESDNIAHMHNNGFQLSFKHTYPKNGKEWTADLNLNKSHSTSSNDITSRVYSWPQDVFQYSSEQLQLGRTSFTNFIAQTDYTNPLTDKSKLELGLRAAVRNNASRNDYDSVNNGIRYYLPALSVNYTSNDNVYAGYATYTNQVKNFGYQVGLRLESSDYSGVLPDKNQQFHIQFPVSLFPSMFLSDKMKNNQELQLNYSRKINRPNFFQLYPYTDYSDSLNITRGNPNLKPEFSNNVELNYQKVFKKNNDNFLASLYFKYTDKLISRFQETDTSALNNKLIIVNTYINASSAYVTGLELNMKNKVTKWWDITNDLNLFTSKINSGIAGQPSGPQFFSWFAKQNNSFKLPKNFSIQLSGNYQSKTVLPPGGSGSGGGEGGGRGPMGGGGGGFFGQAITSQGYVRANYWVDAAIKYDFLKNKMASLTLSVNDIFRTRRSDVHSETATSIQDVFRRRDPQVFRLSFSWRFGKFDPNLFKRKTKGTGDDTDTMNMGQQ